MPKYQTDCCKFNLERSTDPRYIRAMALNNHHVMRADRKLSLSEAQEFMQEMVNSGNVEYIEIDQMLKPFSIPRAC
ncbi:hypothetical protein PA7559_12440 [Pseudoalteromonas distincta]